MALSQTTHILTAGIINTPYAIPRWLGGNTSDTTAFPTAQVPAAARPWAARQASRAAMLRDTAQPIDAARKAASVVWYAGSLPNQSGDGKQAAVAHYRTHVCCCFSSGLLLAVVYLGLRDVSMYSFGVGCGSACWSSSYQQQRCIARCTAAAFLLFAAAEQYIQRRGHEMC